MWYIYYKAEYLREDREDVVEYLRVEENGDGSYEFYSYSDRRWFTGLTGSFNEYCRKDPKYFKITEVSLEEVNSVIFMSELVE